MTQKAPDDLPVLVEFVERRIYLVRGQKVMLDTDLAELYGVPTKVLNQAVKRNLDRFPADFMFQLTKEELDDWRSQIVTSNPKAKMGLRRRPFAFTEHGALMAASMLNSTTAVQASIQVVRAFLRLREMLASHKDLSRKLDLMEKKYDAQFKAVFDAVRELMAPSVPPRKRQIGFQPPKNNS